MAVEGCELLIEGYIGILRYLTFQKILEAGLARGSSIKASPALKEWYKEIFNMSNKYTVKVF